MRRLAEARPVRRFLERPRVERQVALVKRSSVLVGLDRARFVGRELASRRTVGSYRLRDVPGVVLVRHSTPDVVTLDEVFYSRDYDMPPPVRAALASRPRPLSAVDLGANAGYFGAFLRRWFPDVRVTAFEPDPDNAEIVRRTIALNRVDWRLVQACAAVREGTVRFAAGRYSLSQVVEEGDPAPDSIEVRAVDVLPFLLEGVDVLKIDIEGAEWPILSDERFRRTSARAVVLEYHPAPSLEGTPQEVAERRLREAGFDLTTVWRRPEGYGVIWGWKPS
jgi:FkbM family methyltransferase